MARILKDQRSTNATQLAGVVIGALSLIPLAFDLPYNWIMTVLGVTVGLALLTWGYVLAFRFDPNADDPEARKALGRKHAVWGDQLAELLKTSAATPTIAAR
jgi:hypothetical protein